MTQRRMKIYAIANLICFLIQMGIFSLLQWGTFIDAVRIFHWHSIQYDRDSAAAKSDDNNLPLVPLQMQNQVESFGWLLVFVLQALFVLRGLPCFEPGQHYVNCLLLKIQFSFCLMCLVLTGTTCAFVMMYHLKNLLLLLLPIGSFISLKLVVQYLIYQPLKYKDDGRDVVSFADFITIHGTFPAINAWISYQLYYSLMATGATICDTDPLQSLEFRFCQDYLTASIEDKWVFYYGYFLPPSIGAFILLFVEASINLTYFKDCVFAFTTLCLFCGMLWVNYEFKIMLAEGVSPLDSNARFSPVPTHAELLRGPLPR